MLDQTLVWLRMFSGKSVLGQSHSMVVQLLPQLAFNLRVWHLAFLAVKTRMRVSLLLIIFCLEDNGQFVKGSMKDQAARHLAVPADCTPQSGAGPLCPGAAGMP